jgi:hypothetical protein
MATPCRTRGGLDTEKVEREIAIGAQLIKNGAKDYKSYGDAMAKVFGEGVRPHTTELFIRSKALHDVAKLPGKLLAREKNIARRTELYRQKIANRDFAREIRQKLPEPAEQAGLQRDFKAVRDKWNRMVEEKALRDRPKWQRIFDKAVAGSRFSKLTGIQTIFKITAAQMTRIAQHLVESSFNEVMRRVPGTTGRLWRESGVEGAGLAEVPAYLRGMIRGYKEIPGVVSGRIGTYEQKGPSPFLNRTAKWLERASTNLHAAGKHPAKMAAYEHAKTYLTKEAQRLGKDLSDPQVIGDIEEAARAAGNRSIFLRDNALSNFVNGSVNMLEKKRTAGAFAAAKLIRFMLPILRVPTNIAGESIAMSPAGTVAGAVRVAKVIATGLEDLNTAQKAAITRNFKRGMVGAGLFWLGFYNRDKFGGFYKGGEEGDVKEGEANLMGVNIPKVFMHSPPALVLQLGAHTGQLLDQKYAEAEQMFPGQNIGAAYAESMLNLMHEVPLMREISTVDSMFSLGHDAKPMRELGRQIQGVIPQAIQNIATWADEYEEEGQLPPVLKQIIGHPVKRTPKTFGEQIMMGIPGLRQKVPTKEERASMFRGGIVPSLESEMRKRSRKAIEAELR